MTKVKKIDAGRPPVRRDLSLGNRATEMNDLTWQAACKLHNEGGKKSAFGTNRLIAEATITRFNVPPGESGHGVYGTYEQINEPCAPKAIANALTAGKKAIERGEFSYVTISGRMRYVFGGDQPRHNARWDFGGWERDDGDGLSRARRVPRRRRRELIPGGLAPRGRCPRGYLKSELRRGIDVEMEHTNSHRVAREIACDHLTEDRRYYTKLAKIER